MKAITPAVLTSYLSTRFLHRALLKGVILHSRSQKVRCPKFGFHYFTSDLHIAPSFGQHLISNNFLFHREFRLGSILVLWRLISQRFYKFVGENLYICPSISHFLQFFRFLLLDDVEGFFWCVGVWHFNVFGGDECRISIASKNSFIPHKIIVDEFSMIENGIHFVFFLFVRLLFFVLGFGFDNLGDGWKLTRILRHFEYFISYKYFKSTAKNLNRKFFFHPSISFLYANI